MGARLTTLENESSMELEVRVFVPPDRPDHCQRTIRIKPGEIKQISVKSLCDWDINPENPVMVMFFVEGVYTGVSLCPLYLLRYNRVIWDRSEVGLIQLRGIKVFFLDIFTTRCYGLVPGIKYCGRPEVDVI